MVSKFEQLLIEELSPEQKELLGKLKYSADLELDKYKKIADTTSPETKEHYRKSGYSLEHLGYDQHDNLFEKHTGNPTSERIVSPISSERNHTDPDPHVKLWLESNGFSTDKYHDKVTSRMETNGRGEERERSYRIGSLLQRNAPSHILKKFETDPSIASSSSEHQMVVTRNLEDIGGMTSGRKWCGTSCMRLPGKEISYPEEAAAAAKSSHRSLEDWQNEGGAYHKRIANDLVHGTLAAFFTKKGDDNIERPVARTLFKKMVGTNANGETHVIFRPEENLYGNSSPKFLNHAKKFAEENWPSKEGFKYQKQHSLYNDGNNEFEHYQDGVTTHGATFDFLSKKEHRVNGKLHSIDNETPAVAVDGRGFTLSEFMKEGKYHRDDDKPAYIKEKKDKSNSIHSWYQNGLNHRDGDKPAQISNTKYSDNENVTEEVYKKYGLPHREGDNPSEIIKVNGNVVSQTWSKYGLHHRDDGPAHIYSHENSSEEEYYKHGELHREDGPAQIKTHRYENGGKRQRMVWWKNNVNYREGGQPSSIYIEHDNDKKEITEDYTKKDGGRGVDGNDDHPYRIERRFSNEGNELNAKYNSGYLKHFSSSDGNEHNTQYEDRMKGIELNELKSRDGNHIIFANVTDGEHTHKFSKNVVNGQIIHNSRKEGIPQEPMKYHESDMPEEHKSILREAIKKGDTFGHTERIINSLIGEKK